MRLHYPALSSASSAISSSLPQSGRPPSPIPLPPSSPSHIAQPHPVSLTLWPLFKSLSPSVRPSPLHLPLPLPTSLSLRRRESSCPAAGHDGEAGPRTALRPSRVELVASGSLTHGLCRGWWASARPAPASCRAGHSRFGASLIQVALREHGDTHRRRPQWREGSELFCLREGLPGGTAGRKRCGTGHVDCPHRQTRSCAEGLAPLSGMYGAGGHCGARVLLARDGSRGHRISGELGEEPGPCRSECSPPPIRSGCRSCPGRRDGSGAVRSPPRPGLDRRRLGPGPRFWP